MKNLSAMEKDSLDIDPSFFSDVEEAWVVHQVPPQPAVTHPNFLPLVGDIARGGRYFFPEYLAKISKPVFGFSCVKEKKNILVCQEAKR